MKLNPEKCSFGVGSGKFLGFMVSHQGIEINPDKIKAIEDITVVDSVKVFQRLTGHIAALGRFILRSSEKNHRFFKLLKKNNNFLWTPEFQQALEEFKWYLLCPPLLHTPKANKQLYLYLEVFEITTSWPTLHRYNTRSRKGIVVNLGDSSGIWTLFTDGASNANGSELGIALKPPTGPELAKSPGAEVVEAKCDSLLVVNQVNGTFEVKEERMQRYLDKLQVTLHRFKDWTSQHVPRDQNSEADALDNLGSSVDDDEFSSRTIVQLIKSIVEEGHAEINSTSLTWDWRNKYIDYLKTGKLPSDPKESRALCTKAARFSPLTICLGP
ncbi:PREDICTED: uncharacterized protein LOC109235843 [Nicotiana attenuata]|uniref:uncharacterized protein LOC109235843 n=1 Tax=Nicotiana attenuata TaxID=49451 RepID=UPI0009053641|nr:PREDICTED: uncharacterized protein LOC109235843 [Nicotiana attenuata]